MPITNAQKALIHVAKAQLRMQEADYRALLMRAAGATSSTQLNGAGFERVMAEFERMGFRGTRPHISRTSNGKRPGMASPAQLGKIRAMWLAYTGRDDDLAMGCWLETHFHVSHVRFLTDVAAGKCIGVLSRMLDHKTGAKRARENP